MAVYIGKLRLAVLMEAYASFNNFITTVCYRDLNVSLCNNKRVRTTRCDRRTYHKLAFEGRVVFNVLDNPVAFIKVKCRFDFWDNFKKSISKIYRQSSSQAQKWKFVLVKRNYGNIFEK